jgi:hypothetical protein
LLGHVQFPVQSAKFPVSVDRELEGNIFEFARDSRLQSPMPTSSAKNFPVFSHGTGKYRLETGSPMTVSTAKGWARDGGFD